MLNCVKKKRTRMITNPIIIALMHLRKVCFFAFLEPNINMRRMKNESPDLNYGVIMVAGVTFTCFSHYGIVEINGLYTSIIYLVVWCPKRRIRRAGGKISNMLLC